MEIASIIVSSLALVAVIVLLIVTLKRKKVEQPKVELDLKEIGAIQKQLDLLAPQIKADIELAVSKEMNKSSEQSLKQNEASNEKLERFQRGITESLAQRFDALNKQIDDKLAEINKKVDEKLAEGFKGTTETMAQVRERLQAIDTAQRNIEKLSGDVVSLKQVLEGNQSRGQYGEYQLSMILNNVFDGATRCYEEQYTIRKVKDGDDVRADAVVFMPEPNKMICIDSKFPFQDYAKLFDAETDEEREKLTKDFGFAVKKHITAIKDKYIIPGKTAPEALMFIPNDGVFAFIHHNLNSVVDYAREQRVVLTSPSTLPAILFTINMVRIEVERSKNLEEINKNLKMLGKQFELFSDEWNTFSRQLETVSRSREKLDTRVTRITDKFDAISAQDEKNLLEEGPKED